jgi:hypothetical protein
MINDRVPNITDIVLRGAIYRSDNLRDMKLADYSVLAGKIVKVTAGPRDASFISQNVTDLTLLFEDEMWADLYRDSMPHLRTLAHVESLTVEGPIASYFVHFADLFPPLKSVKIKQALATCAPNAWDRAADALCRPGVEVTINFCHPYSNSYSDTEIEEIAKFWMEQEAVIVNT